MKAYRSIASWPQACAAVVLCTAAFAACADRIDDIRRKGELVCGVMGTDEPFSFIDPASKQMMGYDIDFCDAIARSLGVKPKYKGLPAAQRIPELQQGTVDVLTASLTHNKEREALIDFSMPNFITGTKVLVRKDSGVNRLGDLPGKKVLVIKGSTMEKDIRKVLPDSEIVAFETGPQAFQALQQGQGVAYANDETTLIENLGKLGSAAKDYVILQQRLATERLALGVKKGEPALLAQVNKVMLEMESSGEADKSFMKWFGPATRIRFQARPFKLEP